MYNSFKVPCPKCNSPARYHINYDGTGNVARRIDCTVCGLIYCLWNDAQTETEEAEN